LLRLAVRVEREQAHFVLAELLELAPSGVEEVAVGGGVVEYAVYGAPGELPALPDLRAAAGEALVEVSTQEVADDWDRRWREFHRPVVIDGGRGASQLTVRPPWEPRSSNSIDLVIDPGQAFGTGGHATTRLCLELIQELEPGPLVDAGCGSGVLAVAASLLGFEPVTALDVEGAAVDATRANAAANGAVLEARRADVLADALPEAGVTVANILLDTVERLAPRVRSPVFVASGYLASDTPALAGWRQRSRRELDGWAADVFERTAV
jgi:ribosomal protein L11 methyltransferase